MINLRLCSQENPLGEKQMREVREVNVVDSESTGTSMVAIMAIVVVALLAIGLFFWQPWRPAVVEGGGTTTNIIRDSSAPAPATQHDTTIVNPPSTTIVNPPASDSGSSKTEVNVNQGGGSTGDSGGN